MAVGQDGELLSKLWIWDEVTLAEPLHFVGYVFNY